MTKAEIRERKEFVEDAFIREFDMNEVEAHHAVRDSHLSKAL